MRCSWCGVELTYETAQIDHVIPRSQGGLDSNDNLCASCPDCNVPHGTARYFLGRIQRRVVSLELAAVLAAPVDLKAGRELALAWYPWLPRRLGLDRSRPKQEPSQRPGAVKMRRLRARWREEGLAGTAFPFGANA